ncbi:MULTISPECIES: hypothetical protein [Dinoroseobacter]|uniref:hypothetical protein n=1 Tax=Dinoroseobacter TaxID=309512 RepID=UPI0005C65CCE|nr:MULTISPECIES: hypothetical protein [Dinoroseobacter]MDD9718396.1 hypothetical protein [Dinoroseobacter sp. PD6]URF47587.1 hypothetical protein M8008_04660 [Dinoroseobacter shibae]URF51897.1 hypothetical protein M8007_04660 [Dinoroseobacter shibae]
MKRLFPLIALLLLLGLALPLRAEPIKVLYFNGTHHHPTHTRQMRQDMSDWLNSSEKGQTFRSTYVLAERTGVLAEALTAHPDTVVLVLDLMNRSSVIGQADRAALQQFYASGRQALMLDGSFGIRNMRISRAPEVAFPGSESSSGALLANQITALAKAGGGILIGTDHEGWQTGANAALRALIPDAQFRGTTNPSTDGQFLGDVLLTGFMPVKPIVLLRHWESVPNQGEAPVGTFNSFTGAPLQLYSLVEAADKPGGGRKRPYISASFDPGEARYDIDSEVAPEPALPDNMPTRKGPPR